MSTRRTPKCDDRGAAVWSCEVPAYGQEFTVVWPIPGTSVSEDIPPLIRLAMVDAKLSHAVDSKTGAIMSLRTAVDRLQRDKKVGSLTELWERDRLPPWLIRLRRPKNVHHPEDSRPEGS